MHYFIKSSTHSYNYFEDEIALLIAIFPTLEKLPETEYVT